MRPLLRNFPARLAALWRVAALALVVTVVWCAHYDRWTRASWQVPTDYSGDSLEILTRIAATSEGEAIPLHSQIISRLGAPHGANWNAYPSSDLFLGWGIGLLARAVGLFPAANFALLLASVSAALAFYGCARWLRARWEWAFAAALLFAFTVQTFQRGLPHLWLVFSWTVPLALLVAGLIAGSSRLRLSARNGLFCVASAAAIGIGNPYTLFLFLQLAGWAVIAQWFGPRRRGNLLTGAIAIAVAIAAFAAVEAPVWLFTSDTASRSPLVRTYAGTEIYALKPLDLFVPPSTHRWEPLAQLGQRYVGAAAWQSNESFLPYLGLVGIVGLGWLAFAAGRALLRRQRLPGAALPLGWVLAYSSVGGLTNLVALFTGVLVFRATNRFSIFISALVLLFVATRASRWWARRPAALSYAAAALAVIVGLADQLPRPPGIGQQQQIARRIAADRALAAELERKLPSRAMVFQLPVVEFPEVIPPHRLQDYEHFRPYLASRSLCFSYGILKRRSRGHWQRDIANLPTTEMVQKLERYGFAALYVDRRGFADGGERLLRELAAHGRTDRFDDPAGERVVVMLEPARRPQKPMARGLTFGRGWHNGRPGEIRWAYGPASLSYFNPLPEPVTARVRLVLSGIDARDLRIRFNRAELMTARIDAARQPIEMDVTLAPGANRLDLESSEPAVRLGPGRNQLRAFAVHESAVNIHPPPPSPTT